ncbi:lysophospholipase [Paenalkalicoccus suaedae]|uniref:Lysophospholipase n=1 Tax=Paenalkalicoccus suaedae TaxID=2592382 RepID=A0A859FH27_9BACI|nr:alpha/beta hydrolase [Paenalkalicoccus suaedae]QKS72128.1 lysophospholipase [Paenalkalicoccus suaedae]
MFRFETTDKKPKGVFVVVHGAGEYHARYRFVVEKLNEFGYHVIMGDLPGQGTTQGPRGHITSFQQYIDTIRLWLSEARQFKLPVVLLGHSMGGLASTRTLMQLSEKELPDAVVLSSPCFGLYNKTPLNKRALVKILNKVAPGTLFPTNLEAGSGTRDKWMNDRDASDELMIKKVSVRWYRELTSSINYVHENTELFPEVPLYIMQGGTDKIVDKYSVKDWFNQVDVLDKHYKEWPNLYHEVLNEPERHLVFAHMMGFVTTQLAFRREGF